MTATMLRRWRRLATGELKAGPWHTENQYGLTWCGRRIRGASTQRVPAAGQQLHDGDTLCADCRRAQERGRPRAFKRR